MQTQKKINLIERYQSYINLSRRSGTGIEISFIPDARIKNNPARKAGIALEGDYGRKKGFRG